MTDASKETSIEPSLDESSALTETLQYKTGNTGRRGSADGYETGVASTILMDAPPFQSILFDQPTQADHPVQTEPTYFADLNLDQLLEAIITGREEYDLAPFFYQHLDDPVTIRYRQEVFRDLEDSAVLGPITSFAHTMGAMRASLAQSQSLHHAYQRAAWFVNTVEFYCNAVASLASELGALSLGSRGLDRFRDYLTGYAQSPGFRHLVAGTRQVKEGLATVDYTIQIDGLRCTVAKSDREADYSADVLSTFDRFKQGAVKDYRIGFREPAEMNHVEANVLDLVAKLYPEPFAALNSYLAHHRDFVNSTVRRFDREVQFYVSYVEHLHRIGAAGLCFCYPEVTRHTKEVFATDTFDLALATKLVTDKVQVVTNDFFLEGPERIIVVSGPNQGGKTTFARMFGQLHQLANVGCPIPGRAARLFLYDELFVQFEREEDLRHMTGKLEDDLVRVKDILSKATAHSIVVLNEIFASTTLQDSVFLGTKVMEQLIELDLLAVFVTFVEELASLAPSTVSMVSTIVPENPAERTYKVVRKPADGLAFALAIAEKHGVTYEDLKKRIAS